MIKTPSLFVRRISAVGLIFLAIAVSYELVIAPLVFEYRAGVAQLEKDAALLRRYQKVALSVDEVEALSRDVRQGQAQSGVFLSESTDSLAAARLQTLLGQTVTAAGGDVRSLQGLPVVVRDGLSRIPMRLQFMSDIRGLSDLLYRIESSQPMIFVDQLQIRTRLERTSVRGDELEVGQNFLIELVVSSYRLRGEE
ncbi:MULTISPECIES: type II secretion system protein GspM [unclassified Iodidimonas]|jgi:general secretion pathway protein M|uniref:type II secretion system protein GspM n=1 Tax=unclassified Iodidimonas TaxID=2626145 RepID=UPI002483061C|nr:MULTISPECIES: type II secretion system protein GspM [unclassified Iodidimonas]